LRVRAYPPEWLYKDSLKWIPGEVNIETAPATVHSLKSEFFQDSTLNHSLSASRSPGNLGRWGVLNSSIASTTNPSVFQIALLDHVADNLVAPACGENTKALSDV
jgi:hypothetical protein